MTSSFVLIYKIKDLFGSNIKKIIVFKTFDDAYNYGLSMEPYINKTIIYSKEDTLKNSMLWTSSIDVFPKHKCKIVEVPNDVLWNIYQTTAENETKLMHHIIKTMKINNII